MSLEIFPSTQPLSSSIADNDPSLENSQNNSYLAKNEILHLFPPSFVNIMEKTATMSSNEINDLIEFIINYLNSENSYPFNFFDEALSYTNNADIVNAKDVLRFHVAINKLKLFNFFNPNESNSLILKIQNSLKEPNKLISLIRNRAIIIYNKPRNQKLEISIKTMEIILSQFLTSSLNCNFNPTLSEQEYMPIYESLIDLEENLFKRFFERCLYNQSFQKQNLKNDDISRFCEKGSALQGHGMSYSKRGLRNLANLILEQELRNNINIGTIGNVNGKNLKDFSCAAHGPFYLLVKPLINNMLVATEHLVYIVPEKVDKELLISIMDIAFLKDLISKDQKALNIARIFTMQEFLNIPETTISSAQLEKYVQTKIIK